MSLPERGEEEPTALDRAAMPRAEILAGYQHPYRRWLPLVMKRYGVPFWVAGVVAMGAIWVVAALAGSIALQLAAALLTIVGLLVTAAVVARAAIEGGERPARSSVLITGKPRYEAVKVRTDRFDPDDAAVAAEQLAAAQERAADLEAAAIERGRAELVEREAALDLAVETRSTAAALRRITGQ